MKTNNSFIFKLFNFCIAAASLMLVACDSDSIEGLKGEFSDITFCNFNSANVLPTEKLGKGIKALNTQFSDAAAMQKLNNLKMIELFVFITILLFYIITFLNFYIFFSYHPAFCVMLGLSSISFRGIGRSLFFSLKP